MKGLLGEKLDVMKVGLVMVTWGGGVDVCRRELVMRGELESSELNIYR